MRSMRAPIRPNRAPIRDSIASRVGACLRLDALDPGLDVPEIVALQSLVQAIHRGRGRLLRLPTRFLHRPRHRPVRDPRSRHPAPITSVRAERRPIRACGRRSPDRSVHGCRYRETPTHQRPEYRQALGFSLLRLCCRQLLTGSTPRRSFNRVPGLLRRRPAGISERPWAIGSCRSVGRRLPVRRILAATRIGWHRAAAPPSSPPALPCGSTVRRAAHRRSRAWPRYGRRRSWRSSPPVPSFPASAATLVTSSPSPEYGRCRRDEHRWACHVGLTAVAGRRNLRRSPGAVTGTSIRRADWLAPRAGLSSGAVSPGRIAGRGRARVSMDDRRCVRAVWEGVEMLKRCRSALVAGLLAVGSASCGGDTQVVDVGPPPPALTASIAPASATAVVGASVVFAVHASGGEAGPSASWTCASSNTGVATVDVVEAG